MKIRGYDIIGINIEKYSYNNNTAINLECMDGGFPSPFATITVNFEEKLEENMAYLDTNNCPWVVDIMKEYDLGEPTGEYTRSGFCVYPLYKLNLKNLKQLDKEIRK